MDARAAQESVDKKEKEGRFSRAYRQKASTTALERFSSMVNASLPQSTEEPIILS